MPQFLLSVRAVLSPSFFNSSNVNESLKNLFVMQNHRKENLYETKIREFVKTASEKKSLSNVC